MWLLYIIIFVVLIYLVDYILYDRRILKLTEKQFNGPKRLPIIGNILLLAGIGPNEFYEFEMKLAETYDQVGSRIMRIWAFNQLEIRMCTSKDIEMVMTNPKFISKSSQYNYLHDALGEGLLFSSKEKWFARRRIITPTFHFKILEQFFDVFKKHNLMLMDKIEEKADGRIFDIFPLMTASVMDSLCETAMGCETKSENYEYLSAVKELGFHIAERFLTPWMRIEMLYNFSTNKKNVKRCSKIMHDFTIKVIETRREQLQQDLNNNVANEDEIGLKRKMCLLDVLLQSTVDGLPLSNKDIQEEVDTFTFAGHDTSSNAVSFTLFMIAKHPEVQKKLQAEIEEIIGDEEVNFSIVNELKYLDMVIKETMRIYPPVPLISRRLYEEVEFDGMTFPANANYNLSLISLFRDPREFENPDEFIPERFLKPFKSPYSYVPFSAGQRNCIGQKFALYNVKNHLINILRKYEVVYGNIEPKLQINVTLKCDGLYMGFKPRK